MRDVVNSSLIIGKNVAKMVINALAAIGRGDLCRDNS